MPGIQDARATVKPVVEKYNCEQGMLIPILQDIQGEYNYLPKEALIQVAEASIGNMDIDKIIKKDYLSKFCKNRGV